MIDEPPFGRSILEDRATEPSAHNRLLGLYARRGVKVATDNLVATALAGLFGAAAARGFDGSALEATIAGATAFNLSHPLLYGGLAAGTNRLLARNGYDVPSVTRELSEGYASGLLLFGVYNAVVIPVQMAFNENGADPASTVFWCNLVATTVITPARSFAYVLMDKTVEKIKPAATKFLSQTKTLLERESKSETDA